MGVLDFLRKKKEKELPMPPPPGPPSVPAFRGDIEPIRAPEGPEMPLEPKGLPPIPTPPPLPIPSVEDIPEEVPLPPRPIQEIPAEEKEVVFDRTVKEETEVIRPKIKPAFVAVEDYKKIINDTNVIRSKLMGAESFVRRLSDLKNEEEKAFEKWQSQLESVEKKLNYVDQLITKAQR